MQAAKPKLKILWNHYRILTTYLFKFESIEKVRYLLLKQDGNCLINYLIKE